MQLQPTDPEAGGRQDASNDAGRDLLDRLLALPTPTRGRWLDYGSRGITPSDERALIDLATDPALLWAETDSPESWVPVHASRSLAELRSEAAVAPLLSTADELAESSDWMMEELPEILATIGPACVETTAAFAGDRSLHRYARIVAVEALGHVAASHETAREACIDELLELLEGFEGEKEPLFNAFVIGELVDLDVVEAAPLMEAAFEAERVDIQYMGDWEDVQIRLGVLSERLTPSPFKGFLGSIGQEAEPDPLPGWHSLDPSTVERLEKFLDARQSEDPLTPREVEGFLFAIACAPDVVMPSEWLPFVLGDAEPTFDDDEYARDVLHGFMELYQRIQEGVNEAVFGPPEGLFRDDPISNLEENADVAQWSRGFAMGHAGLKEEWEPVAAERDDELGSAAFALSFYSSRSIAERFREELTDGAMSLEEMAVLVRRLWPSALMSYASMGREALRDRVRQMRAQPARATPEQQTGRNDPCPCGSGRKFKKCCWPDRA